MIFVYYDIICDHCGAETVRQPSHRGWAIIPPHGFSRTEEVPWPQIPEGWAVINGSLICPNHDINITDTVKMKKRMGS